jgi:uncharacterized protein (TIGR02757 family)
MPAFRSQAFLAAVYEQYNHPEFIGADPLQFVFHYEAACDREVAGLIAACIAFGNVKQISESVRRVLAHFPSPRNDLLNARPSVVRRYFLAWRHRYVDGEDLSRFLLGIRHVLVKYGSLDACFASGYDENHETVLPALEHFVDELRAGCGGHRNYLLTSPRDGSACKRLNLYLRWMVRRDEVDPGVWTGVPAAKLVVPLDTHMHRMALALGFTQRKQGNLRTALEVTEQFRRIAPDDPVRYDFALTRFGMGRGLWEVASGQRQERDWELS